MDKCDVFNYVNFIIILRVTKSYNTLGYMY